MRSCLGKGVGLWLVVKPSVVKPSIRLFRIAHSIFTSALCFLLDLIQPSTYSIFTCECGHMLDTFGTHITCCLLGGQ
jgi:hypothetical protein